MRLYFAVGAVSAGVIAYEVLLTRLYAIAQWHHFAYMIISIAMLGFGASGTFIALARGWLLARFTAVWQVNAAAFGVLSLAGFAAAQRSPFNPLEMVWDFGQAAYLSQIYLYVMAPFFCAANCIGLAFVRHRDQIGMVYRFNLIGSGLGALGVIALLFLVTPGDGLRLVLALAFAAAALAGENARRAALLAVAGISLAVLIPGSWTKPVVSPYKGLSQALRLPGAEILAESSSPLGRLTVVGSPAVPFRHAPGLSLNSPLPPPEQLAVFIDAGGMSAITRFDGDMAKLAYLDFTTQAAAYHLLEEPEVLVLGAGGGGGVLLARYHGAAGIDAVEIDRQMVRLVRDVHGDFAGHIYSPGAANLHIAEGRAFVAAAAGRYDLIEVPIFESFAASAAGLGGLSETYVYTVEAFADYLEHLYPGGMVAVTRWLKLPPRDSLKLFATAIEALERGGIADPDRRLALIRGGQTTTLLVRNGPFTDPEIDRLRAFTRQRSFDVAYYPGIDAGQANRFNVLEAPYFHDGAKALLGPGRKAFIGRYKFDLRPGKDDRPYFFDFFKWRSLPELMALRRQGTAALIEWGYLILIATLAQAVVLGALLILAPLLVLAKGRQGAPNPGPAAVYFLSLGMAFLFVEIAFMNRLVLFLGHPLYAIAVVLAAFLVFAGLGAGSAAALAARLRGRGISPIDAAIAAIAVLAVVYLVALGPLLEWMMEMPGAYKVPVSLAIIAPLAFWMGMPFPLGLTRVADRAPALVPWAWGVNGCASVASAVLATIVAIDFGFTWVIALAVVFYGLAGLSARRGL